MRLVCTTAPLSTFLLGQIFTCARMRAFFFQAEDGIRAFHVTGVQTCALPILVNEAVNRSGTSFFYRAVEESGASPADVLRAYVVVKEVYGLGELWRAVEALDNRVSIETQTAVYLEVRR